MLFGKLSCRKKLTRSFLTSQSQKPDFAGMKKGIHLINYEEQPDSMHSFLIVLGSATACDDRLNAFATE